MTPFSEPLPYPGHLTSRPPWRVVPGRPGPASWPLHGAQASRNLEGRLLLQPRPGEASWMQRAGASVARLVRALQPHGRLATVCAGPGHNGGDALWAGVFLARAGWSVNVVAAFDPARLPPACTEAWQAASAAGLKPQEDQSGAASNTVLIDGLLGLGARRSPQGPLVAAIQALNRQRAAGGWTLSIDLPSGLHPDSGQLLGEAAVQADATLQLLTLKPGPFTGAGRAYSGEIWFDPLDAEAWSGALPNAQLVRDTPGQAPAMDSHKGQQGDVRVLGGAPGMTGAALLAAQAALAAGAGRVLVHHLDPTIQRDAAGAWALMSAVGSHADTAWAAATVVAGCGGGERIADELAPVLAHAPRLVLDADGLNAVARSTSLQAALADRASRGHATVLTPHPKEAARLLNCETAAVQQDRLGAAQRLAERYHCTVVLKGSGSVVASPGALPCVLATGNGALATAGTGDVLAGWTAGLWASHGTRAPQPSASARAPDLQALVAQAAASHGAAADAWLADGHRGPLTADRLLNALALR